MIERTNEYRDQSQSSMTLVANNRDELLRELDRLSECMMGYGMTHGDVYEDSSIEGKFMCRVCWWNSCD